MDERPSTSVVIATRNRCDELLRTLGELARFSPRPPTIVVDNGSSDDTRRAVSRYHPEVRLLCLPRNIGAAARNIGVSSASTPYVAFCDDDSWWEDGAFRRAEDIFTAHRNIALIAGRTLVGREQRLDPVNALMARSPLVRRSGMPGPRILGFAACAAIVRRDAFLSVGGFNPALFFGAEEKLLACDLAAAGWDLVYAEDVVAHHHPSSARLPSDARRALELRNNVLIAWLRYAPRAALAATSELVKRSIADGPSRQAALGVLRRLPAVLPQRKRIPASLQREFDMLDQPSR
ncbi:glycosyltransferase family 2 protein [Saccharopolyspora sp. 5N102]|uniref:glycosyltransferase family 2 protein n=1 Tax=Saccharopolyspora sp. 5N102 TaxID=3375155 RepID=UPI0037BBB3D5